LWKGREARLWAALGLLFPQPLFSWLRRHAELACLPAFRDAASLEAELEAAFFSAISRDSRDVVDEEVARAGLGALQLEAPAAAAAAAGAVPAAQAPARSAAAASGVVSGAVSSEAGPSRGCSSGTSSCTGYTRRRGPGLQLYSYGGVQYRCTAPEHPEAVQLLLLHMEANSRLLQQRQVLELQAEGSGLVALAALRHASHVTAASSSGADLQQAALNLAENAEAVVVERVKCRLLLWEEGAAAGSLAADASRVYDVVLGCLPSAEVREVAAWVAAAAQLLARSEGAAAVLCCAGGAVGAASKAAAAAGLAAVEQQQQQQQSRGQAGNGSFRLVLLSRA
jgi:hypothetical protein